MDYPILEGLAQDVRRQVLSAGRRRRFARGEVVLREGDPADTLHLIANGRVAVKVSTPAGETATLSVLGRGDFFGELALVEADARTATVVALEATETIGIRRDDFDRMRAEHPSTQAFLVEVLGAKVRRLSEQVTEALFVPADRRVLRRLNGLVGIYSTGDGSPVEIPLTQDDLASMAGTSRATVNRVLGEAERTGMIEVARMRVRVLSPAALAAKAAL